MRRINEELEQPYQARSAVPALLTSSRTGERADHAPMSFLDEGSCDAPPKPVRRAPVSVRKVLRETWDGGRVRTDSGNSGEALLGKGYYILGTVLAELILFDESIPSPNDVAVEQEDDAEESVDAKRYQTLGGQQPRVRRFRV